MKWYYGFRRPTTAIHEGDRDSNPDTLADPDWEALAFGGSPEYSSGLATFGGAGKRIIERFFGTNEYSFELGANINTGLDGDSTGVVRSFDSFSEALEESWTSRIFLGNHFRFTLEDSAAIGEDLGDWVFNNYLQP